MYHGVTRDADAGPPKREADDPPAPEAPAPGDDAEASGKKERVLHTRVPAVLERELKRFAENLRTPVSNLVRAILEDAVSAADAAGESVEGRLKRAAQQIEKEREKLKRRIQPDELSSVFAYQPLTLAQPASCAKCAREMARGERAHLGLTESPPRSPAERIFVCDGCLPGASSNV